MRIVVFAMLFALWQAGWGAPAIAWQWSNPRPSGNNLVQVSFLDSVHGLIVADNGEVSETDNGGETWRIRGGRIEKDVLITAVALDDRTILATSGLGRIWRTTDGGATWAIAATYPSTLVNLSTCGDGALLAAGMGGLIVRSVDRGATWSPVLQTDAGPYLLGVHCDDRQAFAVGESGTVLRSRDQGTTWDTLTRPSTEFLTGVAFADSSHGIVTTDRGRIAETRDGGRTWLVKVLDTLHFLGAIRREGSRWRVTGSEGCIWSSRDAGATWLRSEPMTSMHLSSAAFVGEAGGVAVGNNGLILKETAGGGDWRVIGQGSMPYLDGLTRITPTSWLAFGAPGAILKSTDAGATWRMRPTPDSVRFLASAFRGSLGLLSGDKGAIALSRDGGETWESVATPGRNPRLYGVAWGDSRSAIAVGEKAAIWRTTDAGRTWTETPRPAGLDSQTLSAVSFRPDGTGFIVGYNGAILRSADRGESWALVPSPVQDDLFALAFRDDATGLAVGSHGTVLATSDGGASWMPRKIRPRPGDDYVLSVAWLAGDTALVVGDYGHGWFLRLTTDAGANWSEEPLPTRKWGWALAGLGGGKAAVMGQDGILLVGSLRGDGGGIVRPDSLPALDGPFAIQRTGVPGQVLVHLTLATARQVTITASSPEGRRIGILFRGELGPGMHALRLPNPRRGPTLYRMEGTGAGPRLRRSGFLPY